MSDFIRTFIWSASAVSDEIQAIKVSVPGRFNESILRGRDVHGFVVRTPFFPRPKAWSSPA